MAHINPRIPDIRLSDIDNLMQDSIFQSSNGARLAEYVKNRGGRLRLHNIFEQVAATVQRPNFNFDLDNSEPQALPDSPVIASAADPPLIDDNCEPQQPQAVPNGTEQAPTYQILQTAQDAVTPNSDQVLIVMPNGSQNPQIDAGNLNRHVLITQYQRSNAAKCEVLRHLASSTPKPDVIPGHSKLSTFTASLSPIVNGMSPVVSEPVIDNPVPVTEMCGQVVDPIPVMTEPRLELLVAPVNNPLPEPLAQSPLMLAPCSQAVTVDPEQNVVQRVVVIHTPIVSQEAMMVPETPSPQQQIIESPKMPPDTHIVPRKLSTTFHQLENFLFESDPNDCITSDESDVPVAAPQYEEVPSTSGNNSTTTFHKSILKDTSVRKPHNMRVSFSQQLVQQREISPAPSIEGVYVSTDEESSGEEFEDDEDMFAQDEGQYEIIDEVYSDCDSVEFDEPEVGDYELLPEINNPSPRTIDIDIDERPASPLINVVDDQCVHNKTPIQDHMDDQLCNLEPLTIQKDNKTDLQLVDIITDWDDEEECETNNRSATPEIEIPETQPCSNTTNVDPMDIDSSNLEESTERMVELPPPPSTTFSGFPDPEEIFSPIRIAPPPQFTDSAKSRFIRENDEAIISRILPELPDSQSTNVSDSPSCQVSSQLAEIVQSFRDQPTVEPAADNNRRTFVRRKQRATKSGNPATESYFKVVEKTKDEARSSTRQKQAPANTTQKRKLYVPQVDEEQSAGQEDMDEQDLRDVKVIIEKLSLADYQDQLAQEEEEESDSSDGSTEPQEAAENNASDNEIQELVKSSESDEQTANKHTEQPLKEQESSGQHECETVGDIGMSQELNLQLAEESSTETSMRLSDTLEQEYDNSCLGDNVENRAEEDAVEENQAKKIGDRTHPNDAGEQAVAADTLFKQPRDVKKNKQNSNENGPKKNSDEVAVKAGAHANLKQIHVQEPDSSDDAAEYQLENNDDGQRQITSTEPSQQSETRRVRFADLSEDFNNSQGSVDYTSTPQYSLDSKAQRRLRPRTPTPAFLKEPENRLNITQPSPAESLNSTVDGLASSEKTETSANESINSGPPVYSIKRGRPRTVIPGIRRDGLPVTPLSGDKPKRGRPRSIIFMPKEAVVEISPINFLDLKMTTEIATADDAAFNKNGNHGPENGVENTLANSVEPDMVELGNTAADSSGPDSSNLISQQQMEHDDKITLPNLAENKTEAGEKLPSTETAIASENGIDKPSSQMKRNKPGRPPKGSKKVTWRSKIAPSSLESDMETAEKMQSSQAESADENGTVSEADEASANESVNERSESPVKRNKPGRPKGSKRSPHGPSERTGKGLRSRKAASEQLEDAQADSAAHAEMESAKMPRARKAETVSKPSKIPSKVTVDDGEERATLNSVESETSVEDLTTNTKPDSGIVSEQTEMPPVESERPVSKKMRPRKASTAVSDIGTENTAHPAMKSRPRAATPQSVSEQTEADEASAPDSVAPEVKIAKKLRPRKASTAIEPHTENVGGHPTKKTVHGLSSLPSEQTEYDEERAHSETEPVKSKRPRRDSTAGENTADNLENPTKKTKLANEESAPPNSVESESTVPKKLRPRKASTAGENHADNMGRSTKKTVYGTPSIPLASEQSENDDESAQSETESVKRKRPRKDSENTTDNATKHKHKTMPEAESAHPHHDGSETVAAEQSRPTSDHIQPEKKTKKPGPKSRTVFAEQKEDAESQSSSVSGRDPTVSGKPSKKPTPETMPLCSTVASLPILLDNLRLKQVNPQTLTQRICKVRLQDISCVLGNVAKDHDTIELETFKKLNSLTKKDKTAAKQQPEDRLQAEQQVTETASIVDATPAEQPDDANKTVPYITNPLIDHSYSSDEGIDSPRISQHRRERILRAMEQSTRAEIYPTTTKATGSTHPTQAAAQETHKEPNKAHIKRSRYMALSEVEEDLDESWHPKCLKNQANTIRKQLEEGEEVDEEGVRRSGRTRRIANKILLLNPMLKSAYDQPIYRPPTLEEMALMERRAKKEKEALVRIKASQKRAQNAHGDEPATKKTRLMEEGATAEATTSAAPAASTTNVQQEKLQAQSWMMKLMMDSAERSERLPMLAPSGNYLHLTLDHLSFQERNGIEYSFYIYSEKENCGFLRFMPLAFKKLTKTTNFQLKFLILNGSLTFQINGKDISTKGGDFIMLPENSKYSIRNAEETSLVFMIKLQSQ